jgi:transposase
MDTVEATWTQKLPDWTGAHVRMFRFFRGVPKLLVPDNRIDAVLTNPDNRNIIHFDLRKQTAGGRHQIGTPAGFRSE